MGSPYLVPFEVSHLLTFVHRDDDYSESVVSALDKKHNGPAFTAIYDDRILGCAGIQLMWPGFGLAWAVFSKELFDFPIWATRVVRGVLCDTIRTFHLHRVEMVVLTDNDANKRWAAALGFSPENGCARSYTVDKRDVIRYELVVEER